MADGVEDAGPAALPVAPAVDPDLCKSVAGEILDTLNESGQSTLRDKCALIEAPSTEAERFCALGRLKPGAKTTMVNTAPSWLPKILRVVGLNPENAPEAMAGIAGLMWGLGFLRASWALDKLAKEKAALTKAAPEPSAEAE